MFQVLKVSEGTCTVLRKVLQLTPYVHFVGHRIVGTYAVPYMYLQTPYGPGSGPPPILTPYGPGSGPPLEGVNVIIYEFSKYKDKWF